GPAGDGGAVRTGAWPARGGHMAGDRRDLQLPAQPASPRGRGGDRGRAPVRGRHDGRRPPHRLVPCALRRAGLVYGARPRPRALRRPGVPCPPAARLALRHRAVRRLLTPVNGRIVAYHSPMHRKPMSLAAIAALLALVLVSTSCSTRPPRAET